jgi:hypothetical protein
MGSIRFLHYLKDSHYMSLLLRGQRRREDGREVVELLGSEVFLGWCLQHGNGLVGCVNLSKESGVIRIFQSRFLYSLRMRTPELFNFLRRMDIFDWFP